MKLVILAAGIGSRLGHGMPKSMIQLSDQTTVLDQQLHNFNNIIDIHDIIITVGYKKEVIMERYPNLMYVYNRAFSITNTCKSLLCALNKIKHDDVIFINGDIVFTPRVAEKIGKSQCTSFMVNTASTDDEEVKYTLTNDGHICELSKQVQNAAGEAVGINFISKHDLDIVKRELEAIDDMDYFEKAFENLIKKRSLKICPILIGEEFVREIDFPEDLEAVKQYLQK
jgi:choline kinase